MVKKTISIVVLMLLVIVQSCDKNSKELKIKYADVLEVTVQPTYGSDILYLDSVIVTPEGYDMKLTELKFFLQNVNNGSNMLLEDGLFDYRLKGIKALIGLGTPADFQNLSANIGVESSVNHLDPSAFNNNCVLNIMNANDMHWGWSSGYIFVKIEGKVDTIPDGTPLFDHNIAYHVGLDDNVRSFSVSNVNWQKSADHFYQLPLKFDFEQFLIGETESINVKDEDFTHSGSSELLLTQKIANNFKHSLTPF
jgi:hypothetical protein